ncbi:MAG TPA: F0F1 ATP synthase subunit alpha, partial [Desulfobacterales bacterium]|nr:F0F1 ATP synthase subunit alpha [Desulfobacterales bacterium]
AEYERQMLEFLESRYPEILNEIKEKNDISDELDAKMKKALDEFKTVFQPPTK